MAQDSRARQTARLAATGILLASLVVWILGHTTADFVDSDAYDYAQMSRCLVRGGDAGTAQVFPRHLPWLAEHGQIDPEAWPNLSRSPLIVVLGAGFQVVIGDPVQAAIAQSGTWFVLAVPLFFLLASRHLGPAFGAVCALFLLADPVLLSNAYSGMTEPLAVVLVLLLFLLLDSHRGGGWKWILAGIICGLSWLLRTQLLLLLPFTSVIALVLEERGRRARSIALVFLGAFVVALPWLLRNLAVAGDPFFSFLAARNLALGAIGEHVDIDMMLRAPANTGAVLDQWGGEVLAKIGHNFWPSLINPVFWWRMLWSPVPFLAFFLVGCLNRRALPGWRTFSAMLLLLLLLNFLAVSPAFHLRRFYDPFRPLVILGGVLALSGFCKRIEPPGRAARAEQLLLAFLLLAGLAQGAVVMASRHNESSRVAAERSTYDSLGSLVPQDAVVASDVSEKVCLLADRRTLRLPSDPSELLEIQEHYLDLDYVLLSPQLFQQPGEKQGQATLFATYEAYGPFSRSEPFLEQYRVAGQLADGSVLYASRSMDSHSDTDR